MLLSVVYVMSIFSVGTTLSEIHRTRASRSLCSAEQPRRVPNLRRCRGRGRGTQSFTTRSINTTLRPDHDALVQLSQCKKHPTPNH